MERVTTPLRDLRQRPGTPSPAGSAATEDEGQRFLEDMSVSEMSDKNPAGLRRELLDPALRPPGSADHFVGAVGHRAVARSFM